MTHKKFNIMLINFPFNDLTKTKKRPALVIKSLEGDNTVFCPITTKKRNIKKYEIFLSKNNCSGDIRFDSFIYIDLLFTLHNSLIHKKIGVINSQKVRDSINQKIKMIFSY